MGQKRDIIKNLRVSDNLIKHNCRVKLYPDINGDYQPYEILFTGTPSLRDSGWELADEQQHINLSERGSDKSDGDRARSRAVSFARARNRCFDLLRCNIFPRKTSCGLFVTLTLDEQRISRYEYTEVVRELSKWLDNRVRRRDLRYILVPELHKDGAIHFHGVMNENAVKLEYSGIKQGGKKVYNIADYPFGFTNVKRITGENANIMVSKYIFKYLTKSQGVKVGGRYYLHGGKLAEPIIRRDTLDFDAHKTEADISFHADFLGDCYIVREPSAVAEIYSQFDSLGKSTNNAR